MDHKRCHYDARPLAAYLEQLLAERNESYREASLRAGLDHQAMRRYTRRGQRPARTSVMALADHFGVNPNVLLELAGYPPMEIFAQAEVDPTQMPADIRPLVEDLQQIADPMRRRELIAALRLLLAAHLPSTA